MDKTKVLHAVIKGYRKVITSRYQYSKLKKDPLLPNTFDEKRIEKFKQYALNYLYPPLAKRDELDAAFAQLDLYTRQPKKLIKIVMTSSRLVFKYGRHLPKMLMAGMKALRAFRKANAFENQLVAAAMQLSLKPPYKVADMYTMIQALSKEEIEQFMESTESLFQILHDQPLVKKIIEVIQFLIDAMKKEPEVYAKEEVLGLTLGLDIIEKGNELFSELSKAEQVLLFEFIMQRERKHLEALF